MPRQARLDAPGILHHVMVRGIEGCPIFLDDQDRQDFVSRISELVEMTGTRVLAWTLMDNHLHLLIFSGSQGISKFMRRLLTGHAVRYNLKYHRSGHLFQNRYKSIVCEEDPYLLELVPDLPARRRGAGNARRGRAHAPPHPRPRRAGLLLDRGPGAPGPALGGGPRRPAPVRLPGGPAGPGGRGGVEEIARKVMKVAT